MADNSVIGRGTVVRGNVRGDGSIEIYGRVEGEVAVSGNVTLSEHGSVHGNVAGARLTIGGAVVGDLVGSDAVLLGAGAQVAGDLSAPSIGIEDGARVRGAVRTEKEPSAAATSAASRAREPSRVTRAETPARAVAEPARAAAKRSAEPKRAEPKRSAVSKPEPKRAAPEARRAAPPPAPSTAKRPPPPPVVPALRRAKGKKKAGRQ
jgi:cytoskeletal protein CcmA (bactofilin family)